MSVKNRLNEYLKFKNIRKSHFEKSINVSNGYINSLSGSPSANKINDISKVYNDLNIEWLLTGEGEMIKLQGKSLDANFEKKDDQWQMVQEEPENFNIVQEEKFKPVPYYNVDFSGGWSSEDVFANVRPDFFINNPEFQRSDFACNLVGKSISSIIPDGAVVGFKVIDDWKTYFPQNELYGIITKNEFRTVKIVRRNKENNTLILVPAPSSEFSERFCTEEEIPEEYVIKFFQVIAYAFYERLVI